MEVIEGILVYASLCGQIPEAHPFPLGNLLYPILFPSMETWNQVLPFTIKAVNSRSSLQRHGELEKKVNENGKDMLFRWSTTPEKMSTRDVIMHLSTNVFAGSDTMAIARQAIVYLLLRNPDKTSKSTRLARPNGL
jgi:hypothetical protein